METEKNSTGGRRAGRHATFVALFYRRILAFFRSHIPSKFDAAEDLAQEWAKRALTTPPRDQRNLEAWAFTIARNLLRDYWRGQRRNREAQESLRDAASADVTPQEVQNVRETVREVIAALALLGPERQQVLLDFAVEGLSYEQIVKSRGLSYNKVKSGIETSRRILRGRFGRAPRGKHAEPAESRSRHVDC